MSQAGILDIEGSNPQIPTSFETDDGTAIPIANTLEILATVVAAQGIPARTTGSGNTVTTEIQVASAIASTDITQVGLAAFDSSDFTVDANGFVTLTAGNADLHTARFIVSAGGLTDGANFTTIATAYAAAVLAGGSQTVFVQPGTYTENITLSPNVNISAYSCDSQSPNVTILGKLSFSSTGFVSISGCELKTNADFAISCTGSAASNILLSNCKINANNANAIEFTSSNAGSKIEFFWCKGDLSATRAYFTHSGSGKLAFYNGLFENNGASTAASTISGSGTIQIINCFFANAFTSSSTSVISIGQSAIVGAIIANGTGANQIISNSYLQGGTASSVSIGTGVSLTISNCAIDSTNTNAISGLGTLRYNGLVFVNSSIVNTTTQTVINEGPSRTIGSSNSGSTNTLLVTNESNTASSSAAIVANVAGGTAADPVHRSTITGGQNWTWGLDNSDSDAWVLAASSALGTTNVMKSTIAGEITKPLQPAFGATTSLQSDVTGDGTAYVVIFDTERFDQGGDFDGVSTFTAPVTGLYEINCGVGIAGVATAMTTGVLTINTSNKNYSHFTASYGAIQSVTNIVRAGFSILADMDAGDTSTVTIQISNGTKVADVQAANGAFSAILVA